MATDSELLTSVKAAIAAVLAGLAVGNSIVEYREGGVHIKCASPHELLAQLNKMKQELEAATTPRRAATAYFGGCD